MFVTETDRNYMAMTKLRSGGVFEMLYPGNDSCFNIILFLTDNSV